MVCNLPLAAVLVRLISHLLHFDLEAILVEHDVLLLHLRSRLVADLLHDGVCDKADSSEDADDDEENEERKEVLESGGHCVSI